jgi:hypothetical protein
MLIMHVGALIIKGIVLKKEVALVRVSVVVLFWSWVYRRRHIWRLKLKVRVYIRPVWFRNYLASWIRIRICNTDHSLVNYGTTGLD